jgi:hypothetical protein
MPLLKSSRTAQYPLVATFSWAFDDTAVDTVSGTTKTFGSTFGQSLVFDAIPLPPGAVVIGGEVVVETAYAGPTAATVSVGDASSATRYANAVSMLAAGRTALTLTGFSVTTQNIRLTVNATVANATAGRVSVRVMYVVANRAQEVQIT